LTSLMPQQQQLLEHLEQEPRQRAVLLHAPIGTGVSAVVARLAAGVAMRGEPVVVITDRHILVDQWVYQLRQAQAGNVVSLRANSDVLIELDRAQSGMGPSGVLVVTIQRLRQGAGRRLADTLRPSLLIIDRMPGLGPASGELIAELASRSVSTLVLGDAGRPGWFRPTESIEWSQGETPHGWPSVEMMLYQPSDHENAVYDRALDLLRSDGIRDSRPHGWTRPGLHASTLRVIARLSGDRIHGLKNGDETVSRISEAQDEDTVQPTLLQEAWAIIDALEDLGDDGRLGAALAIVHRAAKEGRLCIVTTQLMVEANYVTAFLRSNNIQVFLLAEARTDLKWQQLQASLTGKSVLVATNLELDFPFAWPERTQFVWWSPPQTVVRAREWLVLATRSPHSTVTAIRAQPPLPGEFGLHNILDALHDE
jgi:type III restriction/modification enzyme restriction subunit